MKKITKLLSGITVLATLTTVLTSCGTSNNVANTTAADLTTLNTSVASDVSVASETTVNTTEAVTQVVTDKEGKTQIITVKNTGVTTKANVNVVTTKKVASAVKSTTKKAVATTKKVVATTKKPVATTKKPSSLKAPTQTDCLEIASAFVVKVNELRNKNGLNSLKTNSTLTKAAQARATELLTKFSHYRMDGSYYCSIFDDFKIGNKGDSPATDFVTGDEYWYDVGEASENICYELHYWGTLSNKEIANSLYQCLLSSPGHKAAMLVKNINYTGVGVSFKKDSAGPVCYDFYVSNLFCEKLS